MAAPTITTLPAAPSRADDPDNFSNKADSFVAALADFVGDVNSFGDYLDDSAAEFDSELADAQTAASEAAASAAFANAAGNYDVTYATKAEADADVGNRTEGDIALVFADEDRGGLGSIYERVSSVWVFRFAVISRGAVYTRDEILAAEVALKYEAVYNDATGGAYSVLSTDYRKFVEVDGAVTLPDPDLLDDFEVDIFNSSGGVVAVTVAEQDAGPNNNTVNGAASVNIAAGASARIVKTSVLNYGVFL